MFRTTALSLMMTLFAMPAMASDTYLLDDSVFSEGSVSLNYATAKLEGDESSFNLGLVGFSVDGSVLPKLKVGFDARFLGSSIPHGSEVDGVSLYEIGPAIEYTAWSWKFLDIGVRLGAGRGTTSYRAVAAIDGDAIYDDSNYRYFSGGLLVNTRITKRASFVVGAEQKQTGEIFIPGNKVEAGSFSVLTFGLRSNF